MAKSRKYSSRRGSSNRAQVFEVPDIEEYVMKFKLLFSKACAALEDAQRKYEEFQKQDEYLQKLKRMKPNSYVAVDENGNHISAASMALETKVIRASKRDSAYGCIQSAIELFLKSLLRAFKFDYTNAFCTHEIGIILDVIEDRTDFSVTSSEKIRENSHIISCWHVDAVYEEVGASKKCSYNDALKIALSLKDDIETDPITKNLLRGIAV